MVNKSINMNYSNLKKKRYDCSGSRRCFILSILGQGNGNKVFNFKEKIKNISKIKRV